jgi:hypothetical protein
MVLSKKSLLVSFPKNACPSQKIYFLGQPDFAFFERDHSFFEKGNESRFFESWGAKAC